MNKRKLKVTALSVFVTSQILLLGAGCNSNDFGGSGSATNNGDANSSGLASSVNLSVYNGNQSAGQPIYSDSSGSGQSLALTTGMTYNFHIDASNLPSGGTVVLAMQDIDVVSGAVTKVTLSPGNNTIVAPSPGGDYAFKIQIQSGAQVISTKSYQAAVGCTNSNFSSASLNPAAISVTAGAGKNLFNFSAANIVSTNNGQAPYLCAFDLTGVGIVDTTFSPCNVGLTNMYVNLVGPRKVGVIVKDACNKTGTVSANPAINLAYTVPGGGTEVPYIFGQVTNEAGDATDPRVNAVNYLATNESGNDYVQSNTGGGDNVSTFSIGSSFNYGSLANGQPSSIPYGMSLNISGITGTFNVKSNQGGTILFPSATLSATYTTDQAGDQAPQISMQSTNCTLTNPHAKVLTPSGTPCTNANGTPGINYTATVEVWGSYVCSMSGPGGSATIAGSFDGLHQLVDGCTGGGGGGGGVPPITF